MRTPVLALGPTGAVQRQRGALLDGAQLAPPALVHKHRQIQCPQLMATPHSQTVVDTTPPPVQELFLKFLYQSSWELEETLVLF